jgi:5-methylcytosine-specific restriction endonuclease McrA
MKLSSNVIRRDVFVPSEKTYTQKNKKRKRTVNAFCTKEKQRLKKIRRPYLSRAIKTHVAAEQKWRCAICTELLPAGFECDHLIPFSVSGNHNLASLWVLCPNCHSSKSRLELEGIMRFKRLKKRVFRQSPKGTEMACCMCKNVFSTYFQHDCKVNVEDLKEKWRTILKPPSASERRN